MSATLSHLMHVNPVTEQYSFVQKNILPDNYRGMLALLRYQDETEKCVSCDLCEAGLSLTGDSRRERRNAEGAGEALYDVLSLGLTD
jgi:hypothetical protein